jgi:hypothetical protein
MDATTLSAFIDELADRFAARVVSRLREGERGMVEQAASPLGRRRHRDAVKRRVARGEHGAAIVGRKHLLSPEALGEELARPSKRERPAVAEAGGVRAQLEHEIRLLHVGRAKGRT